MQFSLQQPVVYAVQDQSVPKTKVITYQQHRLAFINHDIIKQQLMKRFANSPFDIVMDNAVHEKVIFIEDHILTRMYCMSATILSNYTNLRLMPI
jgi:hypothetical protein